MQTPSDFETKTALPASHEDTPLWSSGQNKPQLVVPAKAVDCHFHIFSADFPVAVNALLRPPPASVAAYRVLQKRLGVSRGVLVQPSTYGTDNRAYLGLMEELGSADYRMIAVISPTVSDTELEDMHQRGVRGIRFNLAQAGAASLSTLERLSARVDALGWHCQLQLPAEVFLSAQPLLARLQSRLVFDHVARIEQPLGVDGTIYRFVLKFLEKGRSWVKLSAPYIDSHAGAPRYEDVGTVVSSLVRAAPERMLWGSDWPHATEPLDDKPNDADILDLLGSWVPDERQRNHILVENPSHLYGFS